MTNGEALPGPEGPHSPIILLVEDNCLVRFTSAEILRQEGCVVVEAADASEALILIESGHPFDLVLSDVRMPGDMDGIGLTFAVKELRSNLPIALVSSHLPFERPHAGDAFLAKPYLPQQLLDLVKEMTGPQWHIKTNPPIAS